MMIHGNGRESTFEHLHAELDHPNSDKCSALPAQQCQAVEPWLEKSSILIGFPNPELR